LPNNGPDGLWDADTRLVCDDCGKRGMYDRRYYTRGDLHICYDCHSN
jgi:hypothetical protein